MKYRALGKTGLRVSELSLGASALGGGVFGSVAETDAILTVHTALDLGINLIDVSPFYGLTRAETVLGKALQGTPRERYLLATKVGRYGDNEFDFSAKRVTASVEESLRRLGVNTIDILQAHDCEYGSLDQVIEETLPALRKLQQMGKVRFIGVTGYPLRIFETITSRADVDTILSYNHHCLNDTSLTSLLPMLQDRQIGVISAAPLSQGLLTNRELPAWHPAPADVKATCAHTAKWCLQQNIDIAKLALQFSVRNTAIATILLGMVSADEVRRNVAWVEEPIDEAMLSAVQLRLRPIANRTWTLGRPENN